LTAAALIALTLIAAIAIVTAIPTTNCLMLLCMISLHP
jgi:hypothetical protein